MTPPFCAWCCVAAKLGCQFVSTIGVSLGIILSEIPVRKQVSTIAGPFVIRTSSVRVTCLRKYVVEKQEEYRFVIGRIFCL